MNGAEQLPLEATELLPWAEICLRYPDQYVCLVDMDWYEVGNPEIKTARVVGCGATRRAAFDTARDVALKYPLHTVRFTGVCTEPLIRPSLVIDDEILEFLRP
ncbi:MAG TPA: hypothetical protein VIX73_23765 [Kofleriaceae bacterium]|jgi:hypothetical protein